MLGALRRSTVDPRYPAVPRPPLAQVACAKLRGYTLHLGDPRRWSLPLRSLRPLHQVTLAVAYSLPGMVIGQRSRVDHVAHVGGFLSGLIVGFLLAPCLTPASAKYRARAPPATTATAVHRAIDVTTLLHLLPLLLLLLFLLFSSSSSSSSSTYPSPSTYSLFSPYYSYSSYYHRHLRGNVGRGLRDLRAQQSPGGARSATPPARAAQSEARTEPKGVEARPSPGEAPGARAARYRRLAQGAPPRDWRVLAALAEAVTTLTTTITTLITARCALRHRYLSYHYCYYS